MLCIYTQTKRRASTHELCFPFWRYKAPSCVSSSLSIYRVDLCKNIYSIYRQSSAVQTQHTPLSSATYLVYFNQSKYLEPFKHSSVFSYSV